VGAEHRYNVDPGTSRRDRGSHHPGHWEGDLLRGARNSHVATLVERSSRSVMLVKVSGKDSNSFLSALIAPVKHLPQGVMASHTWDRGRIGISSRVQRRVECQRLLP
jgi:IS30 family transposase